MQLKGIPDSGLRRIAQAVGEDEFFLLLNSYDLSGWYVHASSKPVLERNTGYITLFVSGEAWETVLHYGKFLNFVRPNEVVDVDSISYDVATKLLEACEAGYLQRDLEYVVEASVQESDPILQIESAMNPDNIISSADLWDCHEFVVWFGENFDYNFITTYDGAVCVSINDFEGDVVVVDSTDDRLE